MNSTITLTRVIKKILSIILHNQSNLTYCYNVYYISNTTKEKQSLCVNCMPLRRKFLCQLHEI